MNSALLLNAPVQARSCRVSVGWIFWLPSLLILLAVVIPDFETVNVLQATGVNVESDLLATMATENSIRESLFLLNLLALGGAGALLFLIGDPSTAKRASFQVWMIAGMLGLAVCSLAWSADVELTFRRLVITLLFVMGSWGIGKAWRTLDLVHMVLLLSALFAITGIAGEILMGTFWSPINYRFSGFLHPNRQALSCGLFVLAALTMKSRTGNWLYWGLGLIAYVLLLLTGSRGGALACAVAAGFHFVMATPTPKRIVWFMLSGLLLGGGLLFLALDPSSEGSLEALAKLGRNDPQADPRSLTGRLPIWSQILSDIQERPALGYGYASYWTTDRVHRLSYIHDWEFSNAHSAYLEIVLALGWVGFGLGLTTVLAIFGRGLRLFARQPDAGLLFILSVFVMASISGLVESTFVAVGYEYVVWLAGAFMIVYFPQPVTGTGLRAGELA